MSDKLDDQRPVNPMADAQGIWAKIEEARKGREHRKALYLERVEEFRVVVNRLFSSPDGIYFLNDLIDFCGINSFDEMLNPAKLVEDNGKRKVFLELIRPYLDKSILQQLG